MHVDLASYAGTDVPEKGQNERGKWKGVFVRVEQDVGASLLFGLDMYDRADIDR